MPEVATVSAKSVMDMAGKRILFIALPKTFRLSSTASGSKSGLLREHSAFDKLTAALKTTVSLLLMVSGELFYNLFYNHYRLFNFLKKYYIKFNPP